MSLLTPLFRRVLGMPAPSITRDAALRIASEEAARRGDSPPLHPIVHEGLRVWIAWLDSSLRPSRVVEIDNQTGEIKRYIAPPY